MSGLINYQITFDHAQSSQVTKESSQDTRRVEDLLPLLVYWDN